QRGALGLFIDGIVAAVGLALAGEGVGLHIMCLAPLQLGNNAVDDIVFIGGFLGRPGDDQGRPGLVDQNRIHFVDDGVVEAALDVVFQGEFHIVAQVVEAELVVGAVGDVGGIVLAALLVLD